jgi:AraC-like DNA-binding protein
MILANRLDLVLSEHFIKVATQDIRTARSAIESLHGPFDAYRMARHAEASIDIRALRCGQVDVGTFSFGGTVDIVPHALADSIIVTTAIRGSAGIESGGRTFAMEAGDTLIVHEEDDPVFQYQPDTEILKVRFRRSRLEDFYARTHGGKMASRHRLRFNPSIANPDTAARWVALLRFLVTTSNVSGCIPSSMLEVAAIEEMLMLTLLQRQPHNHENSAVSLEAGKLPAAFGRAVGYIEQHLADDIALADISGAAYCSARTLARVFKLAGEVAPMQYVRKLRLARIRDVLSASTSRNRNVADIAFESGYRHLGEFNRQYRAAFGETPSQTRGVVFLN